MTSSTCRFAGCDNLIPADEDFCCTGCEEASREADDDPGEPGASESFARAVVGGAESFAEWVDRDSAEVRRLREALKDVVRHLDGVDSRAALRVACEALGREDARAVPFVGRGVDLEQWAVPCYDCGATTYPHTHFDEDAGVWVEMLTPFGGRVVAAPESLTSYECGCGHTADRHGNDGERCREAGCECAGFDLALDYELHDPPVEPGF